MILGVARTENLNGLKAILPVARVELQPPLLMFCSGLVLSAEQNHREWNHCWALKSTFKKLRHRGEKKWDGACGCRLWIKATASCLCLPPCFGFLEKSRLSPLSPSDHHSMGMHDTQQMSLATEVSEATVFTQVASSTHEGRVTQIYEGSPLWDRLLASWKHVACFTGW